MSWADERYAIEVFFSENFTTLPIQFENTALGEEEDTSSGWVRLTLLPSVEGRRITLGNNDQIFRFDGFIVVSIFVPGKNGTDLIKTVADQVSNLFHEKILSYNNSGFIRCGVPGLDVVGSVDGGHYQVNVTISYKRDVIRS